MAANQWWSDERARAELQAAWSASLERTVRGYVVDGILHGAPDEEILGQSELLQDLPALLHELEELQDRLEYWRERFSSDSAVRDSSSPMERVVPFPSAPNRPRE
jgi:hypothetical protein